jgi:hypothetical protein
MEHQSVSPRLITRRRLAVAVVLAGLTSGCMTAKPLAVPAVPPASPVVQASASQEILPSPTTLPTTPVTMKSPDVPPPRPAPVVANTAPAKPGEAARLTVAFSNKVIYAPDPTRGGNLLPGLLGRLYVFSTDEGVPIIADGEIVVDVWDNSSKAAGGQPRLIEVWNIDRESFAKFRKRDIIGEGYSIFLPWSTYNVDIRQVNVIVRHTGADGRVLMSPPETLTVDHANTLQRAADQLGVPAGTPVSR